MMKYILPLLFLLGLGIYVEKQYFLFERIRIFFQQSIHGKIWQGEVEKQKLLYSKAHSVVFLGDSHIEQCEWTEVFPNIDVVNRGIPGETTEGLCSRLSSAVLPGTKLVFIQIGINDILQNRNPNDILAQFESILSQLKSKRIATIVTLPFYTRNQPEVNKKLNLFLPQLKTLLSNKQIDFIDLTENLGSTSQLSAGMTLDGLHLNAAGYKIWIEKIDSSLTISAL